VRYAEDKPLLPDHAAAFCGMGHGDRMPPSCVLVTDWQDFWDYDPCMCPIPCLCNGNNITFLTDIQYNPTWEHLLYIKFKVYVEKAMTGVLWCFMNRMKPCSVTDSCSVEQMRFMHPVLSGVKGATTRMCIYLNWWKNQAQSLLWS